MIPEYGNEKFQCPHCNTVASQKWFAASNASSVAMEILYHLYFSYRPKIDDYAQTNIHNFLKESNNLFESTFIDHVPKGFSIATCSSCSKFTLWVNKEIVYPKTTALPPPNDDLDEDIKALYIEASLILIDSPRGAAALLRLALQKLLKQVGKGGKSINDAIKELVSEGSDPTIQKALDLIRVVGNNAVHPGQIDLGDNSDIAQKLFKTFNFIAKKLITEPKEMEQFYDEVIPAESKDHIIQRDG